MSQSSHSGDPSVGRYSVADMSPISQVVEALVVSAIVVVRDELSDALLELTRQIVVVEQDAVFHRSMIPRERGFLASPPHSMA
jgi:hypothetical protein